jgi:hypothetical protein
LNKEGDIMALTSLEILLLIADLVLIIIVVFLLIRLRESKKKSEPEKEKESTGSAATAHQELKSDTPEIKTPDLVPAEKTIEKQTYPGGEIKTEEKGGFEDKQPEKTITVAGSGYEATLKKDELESGVESKIDIQEELKLEDKPPEETPAIPSDTESKIEAREGLKLEDDVLEKASGESETLKPGKPRKPRKKNSKKTKAAKKGPEGAIKDILEGENKAAPRKKSGRKKKAVVQEGQTAGTEAAEVIVKEEKTEEKEPQQESLF